MSTYVRMRYEDFHVGEPIRTYSTTKAMTLTVLQSIEHSYSGYIFSNVIAYFRQRNNFSRQNIHILFISLLTESRYLIYQTLFYIFNVDLQGIDRLFEEIFRLLIAILTSVCFNFH